MKIGDLVLCTFQPTTSHIDPKTERAMPMKHTIKGEIGIIIDQHVPWHPTEPNTHGWHRVLFSHLGYEHNLSSNGIELINEN